MRHLKIYGNTDPEEEMLDEMYACVMPLPKKAGEYDELSLVDNTKNEMTTPIITTHLPTEKRQREDSILVKPNKNKSNKKSKIM